MAFALWLVAPVLGDPTGLALGHPENDVWNHLWGYWYVADALGRGELPLQTELLRWPEGGSLWFIDTFDALLTLPVQATLGTVAAYNAAVFLNFVLAGVGAYALALSVTRSYAGALFAGLAFEATPQLLGQAYNGITETLAVGWLPLAILAWRSALKTPSVGRGLLAGAALGVSAVANWYYGLFAAMAVAGLLGRALWQLRSKRRRKRLPVPTILAGVVGLLIVVGGPLYLFRSSISSADALVSRDPAFVWSTLVLHNMVDVLALVHPGKFYSPDLEAIFGEHLIVVVYLGWALVVPALAALSIRRTRTWAALAAGFLVLTLGPFLYVNGDYLQVAGGWVPLPFLALFEGIPIFARLAHAYRFGIAATLALCVMAAWLIARVQERRGARVALAAALVLAGARIGESLYGSAARFPLPVSEVDVPAPCAQLDGGAVWDLPLGVPVLARSRYGLCQLAHGQPTPYALNEPVPAALWANRFSRYLIELEWSTVASLPPSMPWLDLELGRQALVADGLRWIVLHEDRFNEHGYLRLARFLDLVAEPAFEADGLRVYRLDP